MSIPFSPAVKKTNCPAESRPGIPALIAEHARSTPNAIAVSDEVCELTYGDLNARADDLAYELRCMGVSPEVVVGTCLKRSAAMVIAALAIMKADGAYLPLDPSWPNARLDFVLNDAQAPIVVTGDCIADRFATSGRKVVGLNRDGTRVRSQAFSTGDRAFGGVRSDNLAYVIYTSGSTGQPKGVEATHAGLENLVQWHEQAFAVTSNDRGTQLASPAFDAAVWEIWPYLAAGASLHVPEDEVVKNPEQLRLWLVERDITITFAPTPLAESLMCLKWPSSSKLRVLLTGADTLRHFPSPELSFAVVNNYGPTECTVVTTSGIVPAGGPPTSLPPIGKPITNAQVYILDENLREVPRGAPGELYIGGAGVARGYRYRPELTAERFIPNPFSRQPGSRLYRTGDRARYLPDGQIAFLGRIDDQVKIRGYRIEPDEVIASLACHHAVKANVVLAREDVPGEKRLVAYVVPIEGARLTDEALREFLASSLPEYMMPTNFCRMDALPLTSSGKIDRQALPVPGPDNLLCAEEYVAPRTPLEQIVTAIVSSLLRVESIGLNDNFFLQGGNSLLGAQLIARIRDKFDIELPLLSIFDHPTIAELSAEIEQLLVAKVKAMDDGEALRVFTGADEPQAA